MAETHWTFLNDGLDAATVDRGVTTGVARPPGGGSFVFGFNSLATAQGAVGLFTNQVNFAPMAKGGSVRGVLQRGPSGGPLNFAPFLFVGLQGPSVNDNGYLLGLADGDPHHIVLRKGAPLAEARAWHAGDVNERSISVEIQNPVQLHRNKWQKPARGVVVDPGVHGGAAYEHLDFYDVQIKRVVELSEVLCGRFGIPRMLPLGAGGDVLRTLAPTDFHGVCGHYHVSRSKPDPGLTLWPGLQAAFREPLPSSETSRRPAVA